MKSKVLIFILLSLVLTSYSQKYYIGEAIKIHSNEFKLIGISSNTGVANYRYLKPIDDKMFERVIGDIIVGVKDGHIASTIYNLVPLITDVGVPSSIIDQVQANLPYPMKNVNGTWGVNIDNNTISFTRANNAITFGKDRIVFNSSVKYSLLLNR
jgi:monomeric isocitrate dehydrogenase